MSDIIAVIRNEQGIGMSSIDGELIVVLLAMEGIVIDQQPVMMRSGIAIFGNLPLGSYTVLARHASLSPTESRQDLVLQNNVMLGVKFVYAESERRLLRIELQEERLDA
ncbi:hypothetical protein [Stenomitos frigidus]|uniref:Uncharacterized protein n=1 Tax=Stenomitos frigidus ULC18 TaxID=2107698 RepID=A0A2T1E9Q3_9CYAN|nr:hypothetical protein [Stenomitos frigidus]PSB29441.1 hypothetical protein C7B82_11520 [Stenomitos frigidus ULC18]